VAVAVVANNDKSVYILNLQDSEILERLTFPDCVNRAVMSPDGELLVTVLDDPFLYVHRRTPKSVTSPGLFHSKHSYEWTGLCRIQLEGQKQGDSSSMKGSFALSFSNSGKYLAVATQYGVISVFETVFLEHEDVEPLAVFTSSRPGLPSGAVRAMEFSPGPFDLLAWTESSGQVGVADIRNLFLSRQLLKVDCRLEGVEKVHVLERPGEPVIDPRLRSFRTDSPSSSSTTPDYLGLDFERRQLRHLTREMLDRHHSPLTSEELDVLTAHRIARRQRDALADTAGASGWGPWAGSSRATATSAATTGEGSNISERRISTTGLPAALREFVNPDRTAASFRSFINERNQDRERRSQQQEPRRRSSVILAAAERTIEQENSGASANRTGNDNSNTLERLTLTPPRLIGSDSPNNPWAEIDALYRTRFPGDPPPDRSSRLRIELEDDDRRDFAHRLRQPWRPLGELALGGRDESSMILRGVLRRRDEDDERPPETMGISWNPDGRIL